MGMSEHVVGFRPPDEKWERMKKIYDSCADEGVDIPDEVEVQIEDAISKWENSTDDTAAGFEVDVTKLPPGVTKIRFFSSD